jgi:hypothetical protein
MGQQAIHQTALSQFDTFLEARRSRLQRHVRYARSHVVNGRPRRAHQHDLPLAVGLGPHLMLAGLISFFTATMICLIAILDHPFRGHMGVSPEAFELVYQIMLK